MKYIKIIICFLLSFLSQQKIGYMLPNIRDIQQVIRITPYKYLIINEKDILKINILTKKITKVGNRHSNEFIGYDNGLIFCKIEHYIISSNKEFSTKFIIFDERRSVIKELKFFETIRPLYINRNIIIATTAVDFLEKHFYKISIENSSIEEIFLKEKYEKRFYPNISEDIFGNVWVNYSMRDIVKIIIATLRLNLKTILNIMPIKVPNPALSP